MTNLRPTHNLKRSIARSALAAITVAAVAAPAASAAPSPVSNVKTSVGQGLTSYKGKPKYRARGTVSFSSSAANVKCNDSLSLERRVRAVSKGEIHFKWILIRGGDHERTCSPTSTSKRSTLSFLNNPAPYRRMLSESKLRLRYSVSISVDGATAYRKTIVKPVTTAPLSRAFRI